MHTTKYLFTLIIRKEDLQRIGSMQTWDEVAQVQPLASRIITNSLIKERMSHAYLLQGENGTGKEAIALLLAKSLFCGQGTSEPCNTCTSCQRIDSGNHPDVHWVAPQEQSIKKEQIDYLQREFNYAGFETNQKVYIIDKAETLTTNASNRILKFLEEPALETTAILLTVNSRMILPTIRSRCQVIDLQPLDGTQLQKQLEDNGVASTNAVFLSAMTNRLDDAMALHEDAWFAQARKRMVQLIEKFITETQSAYLFIHSDWLPHFKDREKQLLGIDMLLLAFRDFLYYHIGNEEQMVVFRQDDPLLEKGQLHFSESHLLAILQGLLEAKRKLMQHVHPTLVMEQLTLQIKR